MRFSFHGDPAFAGDGGAELHKVFALHHWKSLEKCDGRYVAQGGAALAKNCLAALCEEWHVAMSTAVVHFEPSAETLDSVDCVRFVGGGGLITYCKPDGVTFVHTLNTESGLCRKLLGMYGATGVAAVQHALISRAGASGRPHPLFGALCSVLSNIPEDVRTKAAPAVAVALRFSLARAATRRKLQEAEQEQTTMDLRCDVCAESEPSPLQQLSDLSSALPPLPPPPAKKKRSVDYILEGTSVRTNRHLSRFAAAPFLSRLLTEPAFSQALSRSSKILKKELIEAYVVVEALERTLGLGSSNGGVAWAEDTTRGRSPAGAAATSAAATSAAAPRPAAPSAVVDLCCGKGFLSLILALEYPHLPVLAVDSNAKIKTEHFDQLPNLTFVLADVTKAGFAEMLTVELNAALAARAVAEEEEAAATTAAATATTAAATATTATMTMTARNATEVAATKVAATEVAATEAAPLSCVAVGMHLCGALSPCAIDLFAATPCLSSLVLVPCCLDKRVDGALKLEARVLGIHPYEAKSRQLASMLRERAAAEVTVMREETMRTSAGGEATEGSDDAKNALIIGRKVSPLIPLES